MLSQKYASMATALCVVGADTPNYNEDFDGMESAAWQSCIGNWYRQEVNGWLKYRWGWWWRTADYEDSGWTYYQNPVDVYLSRNCGDTDLTKWRTKARGYAQLASGVTGSKSATSSEVNVVCDR